MMMTMMMMSWTLLLLLVTQSQCLNIARPTSSSISRREFGFKSTAAAIFGSLSLSSNCATAASSSSSIGERFSSDILSAPPITAGTKYTGHENLYFPAWMEGEWDATQTLTSTKAPLGLRFIGGPQGSIEVAQKTMDEQSKRIGEPVNLRLRFVKTNLGVVEDRAFNLRSRLDAFAGKSVVASVNYADVRESNRASVLASGGKEDDPLTTTLVYFKGPAAQKTFVISHGQDPLDCDKEWSGYELDRGIFALTNNNIAPPVTTDTEVLYSFSKDGNDKVEGKLRLAGYLNPQSDSLYFEAKNRAVSLTDYTLTLKRASGS
ncbi:hypothetical protein ACHAWC_007102 [Mediolabrus comicus]